MVFISFLGFGARVRFLNPMH